MKTAYTFPSNWEQLNAGRPAPYFQPQTYGNPTSYMTGEYNPMHNEAMVDERRRTMARLQNNANRDALYQQGGWVAMAPKPQPQGSFNTPLNLSGNTGYGYKQPLTGGARTDAGQQYVSGLLKKRAQQLEEIQMASETGADLAPQVPSATPAEAVETTLDLLISSVLSQFYSGEFSDMRKEDINQIYGRLLEEGRLLSSPQLEDYYKQFLDMRQVLENMLVSNDDDLKRGYIYLMPKNIGLGFFKISVLLRVIISVKKNFTDAEQQKIIRNTSNLVLKAKNRETLMSLEKDIYSRFGELEPPEIPTMPRIQALSKATDIYRTTGRRALIRREAEELLSADDRAELERLERNRVEAINRLERERDILDGMVEERRDPDLTQGQRNIMTRQIAGKEATIDTITRRIQTIDGEIQTIKARAATIPPQEQDYVYGAGKHKRGGRKASTSNRMEKRNALVRKLMKTGLSLGEASKKIKMEGLI